DADLARSDLQVMQCKLRRPLIRIGVAGICRLQALGNIAEVESIAFQPPEVDDRPGDFQPVDNRRQVPDTGDGEISLDLVDRYEIDSGILLRDSNAARVQDKLEWIE